MFLIYYLHRLLLARVWSEFVHSPKKLVLGSRNGCRETDTRPEAQYIIFLLVPMMMNMWRRRMYHWLIG